MYSKIQNNIKIINVKVKFSQIMFLYFNEIINIVI